MFSLGIPENVVLMWKFKVMLEKEIVACDDIDAVLGSGR